MRIRAARQAGDEAAGQAHRESEDQRLGHDRRRQAQLERQFAEGLEVDGGDREGLHRRGRRQADGTANQREQQRLAEERGEHRAAAKSNARSVPISAVRCATAANIVIIAPTTAPIEKMIDTDTPRMRMKFARASLCSA